MAVAITTATAIVYIPLLVNNAPLASGWESANIPVRLRGCVGAASASRQRS